MTSFALTNCTLWIGDGRLMPGSVVVDNGRIDAVLPPSDSLDMPIVDLHGMSLSPGLIDLMVLGGFNRSILRDSPLEIAREYLRLGVTSCQFCTGNLPWPTLDGIAATVSQVRQLTSTTTDTARILGIYLEGPFQEPRLSGANLRHYTLEPSPDQVNHVLETMGDIVTMVNISPGIPDDASAVAQLREAGIVVSMAHSDAPSERVLGCLEAGTTVLGHCWDNNAGRIGDSGVQQPTLEHVALLDERLRFIHLIADGQHAHPLMVRLVLRCRGVESICLVTDAVIRAGCPDGPYTTDDGRTFRKENGVGRTDEGWLCGSALLLPDMFRNFIRFTGLPPELAIQTVTRNPAASLGLESELGILAPGAAADFVAWDDNLRIRRVWRGGHEIADPSTYQEINTKEIP